MVVLASIFFSLLAAGCDLFRGPAPMDEPKDELGCIRPPGLVKLNPTDLNLAKINIGNFTFGGLDVHTKPAVFVALSNVARDALSHEYLICRVEKEGLIKSFSQREYLRSKLQFAATGPTADQFSKWESDHPVPD